MPHDRIATRERDLTCWIRDNAPQVAGEQKHLDEGSEARAYWHYGYLMALRDILAQRIVN